MRQIWAHCLAIAALAASALAAAQETRVGEEGFTSPPATLDQLDWLVGQWSGQGIGGAPAMESWLPPSGGTMVGTFVQETADANGSAAIMFTEHMYILARDGSLALTLKHFNADLTGWEEKDNMLTFRLVAIEPCAAYFSALTLRCLDADDPGSGIVAAVRMKSDKPELQELVFRFTRMGATEQPPSSCADAYTTLDLNECLIGLLTKADERRAAYVAEAVRRYANQSALQEEILQSDTAFTAYRNAECRAVYEQWKEGSIRNIMSLTCSIGMTDERTLTIWENWLTYPDSTPALLPKPEPTR